MGKIFEGDLNPGYNDIPLTAAITSGVYQCRIQTPNETIYKNIVIIS